jgi:uncharacterized membrane protein YfcA
MDNFPILLVIGLVAGVLSGLFGIGGGLLIVPALTLFMAFSAKTAVATSLAALLLPVGIFAVLEYHRKGLLDLRASMLIALGLFTTTLVGAQITLALPETLFKQAYGVFVIIMGLRFLGIFARNANPAATAAPSSEPLSAWKLLALGLIAGVLSGMFGIGGGIVIVPALMAIFGVEQKRAVGTSLGALLLPVGLPGVLGYYAAGELNLGAAVPVAIGLAIGALGGARIAIGLDPKTMRRLYGIFLLLVGAWFIIEPIIRQAPA